MDSSPSSKTSGTRSLYESNVLVNNSKIAAIEHVDETLKEPVLSSTSVFNKNSVDSSSVEANSSVSFLDQSTSVSQETDLPHYNNNDSLSSNSDSDSEGVILDDIEQGFPNWGTFRLLKGYIIM